MICPTCPELKWVSVCYCNIWKIDWQINEEEERINIILKYKFNVIQELKTTNIQTNFTTLNEYCSTFISFLQKNLCFLLFWYLCFLFLYYFPSVSFFFLITFSLDNNKHKIFVRSNHNFMVLWFDAQEDQIIVFI